MTPQTDMMSKFTAEQDTRKARRFDRHTVGAVAVFVLCVVLILASRLVSPSLGSWQQILTVLTLASFLVVLSFGQGLVILTGGLDLSLPAVITLGGVLTTTWIGNGPGAWYMLPAVLVICAGVGFASAAGIVWLKVPPFIMTMATSIIVSSAALGLTNGTPRGASPESLLLLMKGHYLGIPAPVYFLVIFAVAGWLVQSRTVFGRYLYALGTNKDAARIAGVPVTLISVLPYVISAVCAGFVGMMLVGYANGATLRMGDNYMLPSIAAVVIGGSSILGGSGNFAGTVGGAILLTTVGTVIAAIGLEQGLRTIIEGGIILVALLLLREELFDRLRGLAGK